MARKKTLKGKHNDVEKKIEKIKEDKMFFESDLSIQRQEVMTNLLMKLMKQDLQGQKQF